MAVELSLPCKKEGKRGDWKIEPLHLSNLTAASSVRQAVLSLRALLENSVARIGRLNILLAVSRISNTMKNRRQDDDTSTVDPRFAAARTDPRFQRFPKSQRKVEIDDRFAGKCRYLTSFVA